MRKNLCLLSAFLVLSACAGGNGPSPVSASSVATSALGASSKPSSSQSTQVSFPSGTHPSLNERNSVWDPETRVFTITKNVTFTTTNAVTQTELDNDKNGFYWEIPSTISKVVIGADVTVTGHFRFMAEQTLEGVNRDTSIIFGTSTKAWSRGPNGVQDAGTACGNPGTIGGDDRVHDCEKWHYGAVSVLSSASKAFTYRVRNLTIVNPRSYAVTAIGHRIEADRIIIKNTRPAPDYQSNSDGFGGGEGSSISNSKIDTWDDSIKLYNNNMSVKNVTIIHNLNGAPFQFGWGNHSATTHTISNVKVIQAEGTANSSFNLALFSNSSGNVYPTIAISGLVAVYSATSKLNKNGVVNLPLFYINGSNSKVVVNGEAVGGVGPDIKLSAPGDVAGPGAVNLLMGGDAAIKNVYEVGVSANVTGCADCP